MAAHRLALAGLAIVAIASMPVAAEEIPAPGSRRLLDEGVGFSVNKLGLQNSLELRRVWPLSASRNPLLSGAHIAAGVSHYLTPSYTRLGAWVEISPLSILDVRVGAEPGAYFGTFGSLMSFASYNAPFDDSVRTMRKGEARPGTGSRLHVSPTLKMKLGALVAASSAEMEWWHSSAAGPLYYEPSRDTLLKVAGDRLLTVSTVLLHQQHLRGGGELYYGLGHNLCYVLDVPQNRSQQIGLVVSRHYTERRFGLNAPSIGGRVSYYLSDPSRKGQLTAAMSVSLGLAR